MAETKPVSATATGTLIASKGARCYGFRLIGGAVATRATFRDGGAAGLELCTLSAVAGGPDESDMVVDAHTDVHVTITNVAGAAVTDGKASVFVDKVFTDWSALP